MRREQGKERGTSLVDLGGRFPSGQTFFRLSQVHMSFTD